MYGGAPGQEGTPYPMNWAGNTGFLAAASPPASPPATPLVGGRIMPNAPGAAGLQPPLSGAASSVWPNVTFPAAAAGVPLEEVNVSDASDRSRSAPGDTQSSRVPSMLAILCDGQRLEFSTTLDDLAGFRQRASGSFFQALLDPEAEQFKDMNGALVIKDVPLPLVRNVWRYLMEGVQPSPDTFTEFCEWRRACDYFALAVPDPLADVAGGSGALFSSETAAYATHRYLMVRAACSAGLSPLCYVLKCGDACALRGVPAGFDAIDGSGALRLQALTSDPPLEVELEHHKGSLRVRFMREALWQHIGGHACMRHKRMVALKVRYPKQRPAASPLAGVHGEQFQVVEMYIHMSPSGLQSHDVCIATWPSFWCLVRIVRHRASGQAAWTSWNATFEICPGAICLMADDLVVQVVSQPRSLRKCFLRICGGELEHEVRVKLVAPAPFSTPHARSGKGKASFPGKGVGPSLITGQKYYKYTVPSYDTPTPEDAAQNPTGRCMKQVWVIRRKSWPSGAPHLVILVHAFDGRVAIAQLSGENGCIPPLYGAGSSAGPGRKTCAIWGAKAWHWGQHGVGGIGQYRRSYDVPKCNEVMAVALEDMGRILVLHRPRAQNSPQIWTVNPPQEVDVGGVATASFFRIHGKGKGTGGKNKGGKGNSIGTAVGGSWYDDHWGTANARQSRIPDDIVAGVASSSCAKSDPAAGWPLFVPLSRGREVGGSPPEMEILRLSGDIAESKAPHGQGILQSGEAATWHVVQRLHVTCQQPSHHTTFGCWPTDLGPPQSRSRPAFGGLFAGT